MGSGGDGSVVETDPVTAQDKPERDENFTYDFYVSDAGMAARRGFVRIEEQLKKLSTPLSKLKDTKYPSGGQVSRRLLNVIHNSLVFNGNDQSPQQQDIVHYNPLVLHLALRNPMLLASCRAPELELFWRECVDTTRARKGHNYLAHCPAHKNPFDHLMGAHLHAMGRRILTNKGKEDFLSLPETEQFIRTKQALGFFLEASKYGYSFSIKTLLNFFLNTITFADTNHLPGLVDDLLALTDTVSLALGALGYLLKSFICSDISAMIGRTEIRTPENTTLLDDKQRLCDREAFIAALIAKRIRFMPGAHEYFEMHRPYLEQTSDWLHYRVNASYDDDEGFWQALLAYLLPDEFLKNRGDVIPHMFIKPGERVLTEDGSKLSEDYAKRYFFDEDTQFINDIIAAVNAQAQGIMDAREDLTTDPFFETARVLSENLPSNTHPTYHPFWRFRVPSTPPDKQPQDNEPARARTPAMA